MKHRTVLLVEDNGGDQRLTREALMEKDPDVSLNIVHDGVEALAYLRHEGQFHHALRPDLIILDLNLPKKDGRQVLAELKTEPLFRQIPVVVLTTSNAYDDVVKSYDYNANCFITKPVDVEEFFAVVGEIYTFWFEIAALPPSREA